MKSATRTIRLILAVLLAGAVSASAQDAQNQAQPGNGRFTEFRAWAGEFSPNAHSDFLDSNFQNFTATRSRLDGVIFGGDYVQSFDRHNGFSVGGSVYVNTVSEPARYVNDESGNPLEHHLEVNLASLTASYLLFPAGTDHRVIPYLGAGAGVYFGYINSYRHATDTTPDDCEDPDECGETSYTDKSSSTFYTLGYFIDGGLEVAVNKHVGLLVDGRYTVAHASLGGDFKPDTQLDLSGGQVAAGLSLRF